MVYRKAPSSTYYLRVTDGSGRRRICSTGTTLKSVAVAVEAWVVQLRARHDPHRILDAIVEKRLGLVEAYRLGDEGARLELARQATVAADVDLQPMLAEFVAWKGQRKKGGASALKYQAQLTKLLGPAPWLRSTFTPVRLSQALDTLAVKTDSTRNRYKAACSAFAKYLVRRGVLPANPLHGVEGYSESRAQEIWYAEPDAKRILLALPAAWRLREALMASCGMDWTDCSRLRRRDIDLDARTVRCHGSKTPWRNREIRITERWVVAIIRPLLAGYLPDALVCAHGTPQQALRAHRQALTALALPDSTLHNWRHHYAVTALRRGEKPTVVAYQLGKANVKDVLDRYGKYVPGLQDYVPESDEAGSATDLATNVSGGL